MKKLLIIYAIVFFQALIAGYGSFAQSGPKVNYAKFVALYSEDPSISNSPVSDENISLINNRAIKDFKKTFKSVSGESWYKLDDGGFLARFTANEIKNSVYYDKKGKWICTGRNYSEKELPKDVRARVKSVYYDFTITVVQEFTFPEHLVYIIHMENETTWLNIRIGDEEMEVMQEFLKK